MKRFASIEWLDNAILYSLELVASVSVLFLAGGLIASVANVLTSGEIISSSEFGKQFYAWSQAIGIDASIPGVILRLVVYGKQKERFRCGVYTVLSLLVLFTAFNISNVESMTQTLNTPLVDGYSHSLVSVDILVTIRSLTVILLIVSHALKHLHTEATPSVKAVKPKSVQPTQTPVRPEAPVVKEELTLKEPTPIHKSLERVKEYLAEHPKASAREVGRALGMSAPTAAKWVKRIKESA
ncbi:MAG TPA: AsnC family protein [Ktedonobacteraceae bacterium]|nr:AsnC family protein [Ktedonobacteraceae bacterium]